MKYFIVITTPGGVHPVTHPSVTDFLGTDFMVTLPMVTAVYLEDTTARDIPK